MQHASYLLGSTPTFFNEGGKKIWGHYKRFCGDCKRPQSNKPSGLEDLPYHSKRPIAYRLFGVHSSCATGERWRWVVLVRYGALQRQRRQEAGFGEGTIQRRVQERREAVCARGGAGCCRGWRRSSRGGGGNRGGMPLARDHRAVRENVALLPVSESPHLMHAHHIVRKARPPLLLDRQPGCCYPASYPNAGQLFFHTHLLVSLLSTHFLSFSFISTT